MHTIGLTHAHPATSARSYLVQMRNISALKDLDHQVGIDHTDHLPEVSVYDMLVPMYGNIKNVWILVLIISKLSLRFWIEWHDCSTGGAFIPEKK